MLIVLNTPIFILIELALTWFTDKSSIITLLATNSTFADPDDPACIVKFSTKGE